MKRLWALLKQWQGIFQELTENDKDKQALAAEKAVSILKKYKLQDEHNILADCRKIIEATKSNHTSKMALLKEIMQNQFRLRQLKITR